MPHLAVRCRAIAEGVPRRTVNDGGSAIIAAMASVLEAAAERLGLSYGTSGGVLALPFARGEIDGQKVRCTWSDRQTRVEALLQPPLDLGLAIHSRGFVELPSLSQGVLLGDANWDAEVFATADDAARAAVLFAGDARSAVLRVNATHASFEMTDKAIAAYALQFDVEALVQAFQLVARAGASVSAARKAVPVAAPIAAHAAALRSFAPDRPLKIEETPLHAHGDVGGARVIVRFVRIGRSDFDLEVRASALEPGQPIGLVVHRESMVDRVKTFLGGQDIETGDPAFDPAFLVRAGEAELALGALDDDVRALLLDLRARFETVALDDAALVLRGAAKKVRPEDLAMVLEAAGTVVERTARAGSAVRRGAYR